MKPRPPSDNSTIRLDVGLGDLCFGASMEEAEAYFGPADERDQSEVAGATTVCLSWHTGVICWFDSDDDFRLGCIQVEHEAASIAGHTPIGQPRLEVLKLLQPSFGEPELENQSVVELPDYWLAQFDDHRLNLWFENGVLASIQWGCLLDDDGDPVWPN